MVKKKSSFDKLHHVGLVVKDMDKAIQRFTALGIGPFKQRVLPADAKETYRGKPFQPSKRVKIFIAMIGDVELELIQPINGKSPHQEFLDKKGEGIQHLGFMVDDLEKSVKDLTKAGSEILLTSEFKGGGGVAYLDLDAADVIVELVQPPEKRD